MLKKLVKYGNSNALVLDKAIMELIGLSEGDTVKLVVNGDTLTIRPTSNNEKENFIKNFATGQEIMTDMWQKDFKPALDKAFATDPKMQDWRPGNKKFDLFVKKSQELMTKNQDVLVKITSPEIYNEIQKRVRLHNGPIDITIKNQIMMDVYKEHAPEYLEYWKKVEKLREECGLQKSDQLPKNLSN